MDIISFYIKDKDEVETCKSSGIKEGVIFTYDEEGRESVKGIDIKILPVWKWLLRDS